LRQDFWNELASRNNLTACCAVLAGPALKTTALTNITCTQEVSVLDAITSGAHVFGETNSVAATGTGTTRTCTLSIPYSWSLTTQSSDNVTTSYAVFGTKGTTGLPQRTSTLSARL
jgi:hypothetical protein